MTMMKNTLTLFFLIVSSSLILAQKKCTDLPEIDLDAEWKDWAKQQPEGGWYTPMKDGLKKEDLIALGVAKPGAIPEPKGAQELCWSTNFDIGKLSYRCKYDKTSKLNCVMASDSSPVLAQMPKDLRITVVKTDGKSYFVLKVCIHEMLDSWTVASTKPELPPPEVRKEIETLVAANPQDKYIPGRFKVNAPCKSENLLPGGGILNKQ